MPDFPIDLSDGLGQQLSRILDVEGKIARALDALGPVAGRDVLLLGGTGGTDVIRDRLLGELGELGARVTSVAVGPSGFAAPDASADVVVSLWSSFRGPVAGELAEAERVLRAGGRLLVVHDYGRDDVSHLGADRPEQRAWSRPGGPFLSGGFKVRVVHCFWTFESVDAGGEFLASAFADAGRLVAAGLKRPRLSYNVAIYHRTFGEPDAAGPAEVAKAGAAEVAKAGAAEVAKPEPVG